MNVRLLHRECCTRAERRAARRRAHLDRREISALSALVVVVFCVLAGVYAFFCGPPMLHFLGPIGVPLCLSGAVGIGSTGYRLSVWLDGFW